MGIQHWGAFGGFQNKTGALVGHYTNGQNVITAIPHPSQKPATTAQINQRAKFKTVVSFLSRLTGLVRVGFRNAHEAKQSAFNAAFVYNYQNAVIGVGPDFTLDFEKFMYSKGNLSEPYAPEYLTDVPAKIKFSWLDYLGTGIGAQTDMFTVVVYCPVLDQFVSLANAVSRSALTYTLQLPPPFSGKVVNAWVSMVSADGKLASNSISLPDITVL
jgi:hypothetical protein